MRRKKQKRIPVHPLSGLLFSNLIRSLRMNRKNIEPRYIPVVFLSILSNLLYLPLRIIEKIKYSKHFDQTKIDDEPVFIIGHWRSGTTHLHNLMSQDENFGFVTTLQAFLPYLFMTINGNKLLRIIFNAMLPKKRPMDEMIMDFSYPQEEEYALRDPFHKYLCYFPKTMKEGFEKFVLFQDISTEELRRWKENYLENLKKTTFAMNNKRLLIKNPSNTARIKILLEMFPKAKFVAIHRNPYELFPSTLHLFTTMIRDFGMQKIDEKERRECVFYCYEKTIKTFWETKNLIPKGNLIEVRFEDLEKDPLETLAKIYSGINLPYFEDAKSRLEKYIFSIKGYQKNKYALDKETIKEIKKRWGFAIEEFGYDFPEKNIEYLKEERI